MQWLRPIITCFCGILYISVIIYSSSPSHPVFDAKLLTKITANSLNELFTHNDEIMLWTVNKEKSRLELWKSTELYFTFDIDGHVCCMARNGYDLSLISYKIQEEDMIHEQVDFSINNDLKVTLQTTPFPGSLKISRCSKMNESIVYTRNQDKRLFRVKGPTGAGPQFSISN